MITRATLVRLTCIFSNFARNWGSRIASKPSTKWDIDWNYNEVQPYLIMRKKFFERTYLTTLILFLLFLNGAVLMGTLFAHMDGGVPNMVLEMADRSAFSFGRAVYFFELACAVSGYLLGVNPFDQPGVEAYKKNMFALLGKPGYEEQKAALEARING